MQPLPVAGKKRTQSFRIAASGAPEQFGFIRDVSGCLFHKIQIARKFNSVTKAGVRVCADLILYLNSARVQSFCFGCDVRENAQGK